MGIRVGAKLRVRGRWVDETLIQQGWSGKSVTETAGGGALGDTGKGLGGQEVTCGRVFSKQADQRQPRRSRHCGRETLHAPTGDTGIHFLWNASGIPGNRPTSTTSLARGTHPLTGNGMGSSAGKLHPSSFPQQHFSHKGFTSRGQLSRKIR